MLGRLVNAGVPQGDASSPQIRNSPSKSLSQSHSLSVSQSLWLIPLLSAERCRTPKSDVFLMLICHKKMPK